LALEEDLSFWSLGHHVVRPQLGEVTHVPTLGEGLQTDPLERLQAVVERLKHVPVGQALARREW